MILKLHTREMKKDYTKKKTLNNMFMKKVLKIYVWRKKEPYNVVKYMSIVSIACMYVLCVCVYVDACGV